MLDTQNKYHPTLPLRTLIYSAFNQHLVDWINAAGAIGGTSSVFGKIFMCNSTEDSSDACTNVSRNTTYLGFAIAVPVILIEGIPLLIKNRKAKKILGKIQEGISVAGGVLSNQTFYLLVMSWGTSLILQTDNIDDALFIGAIGVPSLIGGILTPADIRYKFYHLFNCCKKHESFANNRNFCEKLMDGIMGTLEGSATMVLSIKTLEQIIDYIIADTSSLNYSVVNSQWGKIARGVGGGCWGTIMGVKQFKHSPYDSDSILEKKTKDFRDVMQSNFTTFTFYTTMIFTILHEVSPHQTLQFIFLGILTLLSLAFLSKNLHKEKSTAAQYHPIETETHSSRSNCWGGFCNYFKSASNTNNPRINPELDERTPVLEKKRFLKMG